MWPRWCYALRLRRRPSRAVRSFQARALNDVSRCREALRLRRGRVGAVASSRLCVTFRPHPRHRWCRGVVWSRMRVAFRLRRRHSAAVETRMTGPFDYAIDMESVPLTAEAIALTEKKMDMSLEDIVKMSKKKIPAGKKATRQPIKKRPFQNGNSNQANTKVQRFMESRSSIRQGVLAQTRSNLGGNQFQITKQAAKKAATMPVRGRADRWNKPSAPSTSVQRRPVSDALQNSKGEEMQKEQPRTMDALFAQMRQQRMRIMPPQQSNAAQGHHFNQQRRVQQQRRGRGGYGGRNGGGNR